MPWCIFKYFARTNVSRHSIDLVHLAQPWQGHKFIRRWCLIFIFLFLTAKPYLYTLKADKTSFLFENAELHWFRMKTSHFYRNTQTKFHYEISHIFFKNISTIEAFNFYLWTKWYIICIWKICIKWLMIVSHRKKISQNFLRFYNYDYDDST